jgi:hypothetical protein
MSVIFNSKEYSKNIAQYPGYYEYRKLKINNIDVIPNAVELNIFEDLLSPTMTGSLVIVDTKNMIKNIPIIGEETLEIEVFDGYSTLKGTFMIYKISDREQINFGVLKYTLNFCSAEMYLNAFTKVSKAYDSVFYQDAIKDIKENYLKSSKELLASTTKLKQCFVIPNWNPLNACSWIASRAQDEEYVGGNFLFFEDKDRFNFLALENLIDETKNKPFAEVSYDPMRKVEDYKHAYSQRQEKDTMRFEKMSIKKSSDVLENMSFGMYKNRIKLIDIIHKGSEDFEYNYFEDFYKSKHLKGKLGDSYPLSSSNQLNNLYDMTMDTRVFVKHQGLFTNEVPGGNQVQDWYSPRLSQMFQLDNFVIEGILPGELEMKVGMILKFDMPNVENIDIGRTVTPDLAYSGNYLITSLRRMFQKDKFWIVVEIVKDSMTLDRDTIKV